ncbi:MAG: zinc ribbon domain-containing protein [Lachnospiraceae bacterium]|nr:zinc ribbon domain-containing protein [Lachnospiraceae bacterium]
MERFCKNCGNTLEDTALFCPECGEPAGPVIPEQETPYSDTAFPAGIPVSDSAAEPVPNPAAAPGSAPFSGETVPPVIPPVPVQTANPKPAEPRVPEEWLTAQETGSLSVYNKPLTTAHYFWTLLLFSLPGIGLIAMLIMAFTAKNTNRKNFAQACLIWVLILLILLGLFMLVLVVSGKNFGVDLSKFSLEAIWEGILKGMGFLK